jgi:hypothetical protein
MSKRTVLERKDWLVMCSVFILLSSAAASTARRSPESLADDFVAAWDSHDVKAFDRLFRNDAIWIPVAEVIDEGAVPTLSRTKHMLRGLKKQKWFGAEI